MVRPLFAIDRCTAWRIHQVAYVENLRSRRQSNFSTARFSPSTPSWIRSRKGTPCPRYCLAIDTTSRRFDSIMRRFAIRSPLSMRLGQLHLFILGQQRVTARLAQEQIEAVGGRDLDVDHLDTLLRRGRIDHLDAEAGQLIAERLDVVRIQVDLLSQSRQLILVQHPALLAELDQEPGLRLDDLLLSHTNQLLAHCVQAGQHAAAAASVPTFALWSVFPPFAG